ncbi:hypothetical protein P3T36_000885 [Kitasatospora sp. MAP12-15]|uniref:hypothetical protein n=1 Tax=Kitasatospora sp. MAP12-44 TaxID=3035099 RepID=UPI0024762A5E|nr:hypothetical protein [Kitasatospora sp. MAP12-44]MDH6114485.1 hypothetical protein [Kitasatospora sp. MAP12-44]
MSEWTDPRYAELVAWYRQAGEDAPQAARDGDADSDQEATPVRAFLFTPATWG